MTAKRIFMTIVVAIAALFVLLALAVNADAYLPEDGPGDSPLGVPTPTPIPSPDVWLVVPDFVTPDATPPTYRGDPTPPASRGLPGEPTPPRSR